MKHKSFGLYFQIHKSVPGSWGGGVILHFFNYGKEIQNILFQNCPPPVEQNVDRCINKRSF